MPLAYKPATRIAANKSIANIVTDLIFNLNKHMDLINFFFLKQTENFAGSNAAPVKLLK